MNSPCANSHKFQVNCMSLCKVTVWILRKPDSNVLFGHSIPTQYLLNTHTVPISNPNTKICQIDVGCIDTHQPRNQAPHNNPTSREDEQRLETFFTDVKLLSYIISDHTL